MTLRGQPVANIELTSQPKGNAEQERNGNHRPLRLTQAKSLVLLDSRVLDRQCLARCLGEQSWGMEILAFGSVCEWRQLPDDRPPVSAVLLNIGGRKATDEDVAAEIRRVTQDFSPAPVVVLADSDEIVQILKALESGARGYIPSSICLDVCVEAVNLVVAGGIFIPASSILSLRKTIDTGPDADRSISCIFTPRQEKVIQALRQGKANKIIAYELSMRESTVKIHVRNIMKKLNAHNRTEVVYKLSQMSAVENTILTTGL
jgi:DNA-binding NarL/FixJ family response regulator